MNMALTGATGAVGSYLAHRLMLQGRSLALIGRGPIFEDRARDRIGAWGAATSLDRAHFLEWDRTPEFEFEGASCLIHAAADTNLSCRNGEARVKTNLDLLNRALALCERWRIPRIDFISSAYVCGNKTGLIPEERHRSTDGFRNPYEESKWLCEERLFAWNGDHPRLRVVHRPSLILPPASHAKRNTPRAFARLFEKLRLLSHRTQAKNFSVSIPNHGRIGFVALTAFAEDFLNLLDRKIPDGSQVFQYSSDNAPSILEWISWLRESIPQLEVNIRGTCPLGKRILGELEPYLQGEFVFEHLKLEAHLGGRSTSRQPISADFLRGLIDQLIEASDLSQFQRLEVEG